MQFSKFLKILVFFVISAGLLHLAIGTGQELKKQKEIDEVDISKLPKVINGVKKMVLVPGSTFYIDETPITYADFQKYVEAGGTKSKYWDYETYNQPGYPVTGVNWYHAVDYCSWRGNGYRLPTEAEFEYAARGGLVGKLFPWGDEFDPTFANFDNERGIMKGEWWRLAKVKDTPPNNYGLYGMSGNVWHWTNDWYELGRTKVLKGGSWGSISSDYLKIEARSYTAPSNYNYDIGFRCLLPLQEGNISSILNKEFSEKEVAHEFYQYKISHYENATQIDLYSENFIDYLNRYIADYYPNCIYFQTRIDEQEIINPREMAELIVKVSKEYNLHPLFLTGIMAAESGFGTVSFPRWYNNPMAYHWENRLMKNELPTYIPTPNRNRKYKDLKSGFREFAKGIRRDIYIKAAQKDFDAFHLIYVGYQADEWMDTISKVYKDVLGTRLEPHFPEKNVGELIYTDW